MSSFVLFLSPFIKGDKKVPFYKGVSAFLSAFPGTVIIGRSRRMRWSGSRSYSDS